VCEECVCYFWVMSVLRSCHAFATKILQRFNTRRTTRASAVAARAGLLFGPHTPSEFWGQTTDYLFFARRKIERKRPRCERKYIMTSKLRGCVSGRKKFNLNLTFGLISKNPKVNFSFPITDVLITILINQVRPYRVILNWHSTNRCKARLFQFLFVLGRQSAKQFGKLCRLFMLFQYTNNRRQIYRLLFLLQFAK